MTTSFARTIEHRIRRRRVAVNGALVSAVLAAAIVVGTSASPAHAAVTNTDIVGPAGSGAFGRWVEVLPNGNFVVVDSAFDSASATDVGAVYLYNGSTGALISTLTGSTADDRLGDDLSFFGSSGITVVGESNFIIRSPYWDNGAAVNAGAVTWVDGRSGRQGTVSAANSLVGTTAWDTIAQYGVTVLKNGNYVVRAGDWDNGAIPNAGAAVWGSGATGISGPITTANSLYGPSANDFVGGYTVALSNGNYVTASSSWHHGADDFAGAVTWGNGATGTVGPVTEANSLIGDVAQEQVGGSVITALTNGNYVVSTPQWRNGAQTLAGAATWGNGLGGTVGPVSAANSLVGSTTSDLIGYKVFALTNGNYVTASQYWTNGTSAQAGAVTWGNGATGTVGVVGPGNSLVGTKPGDFIGAIDITPLTNGNYVVNSHNWDNGSIVNAGAVTWGNGATGTSGELSAANSLVGTTAADLVGQTVSVALANGNYVVWSKWWDSPTKVDVGAITWGNGATGTSGPITTDNSLTGATAGDGIGSSGVTALINGNFVVSSPGWDNVTVTDAGAATWLSGNGPTTGVVTPGNSLVGATADDHVGGVLALSNGNYVVVAPDWDNGAIVDAGAATWGNGTSGVTGMISSSRSLVGASAGDLIGQAVALTNGDYLLGSAAFDNGAVVDAGAVTVGSGSGGTTGVVSAANSIVGSTANDALWVARSVRLPDGAAVVISTTWNNGAVIDAGAVTFARLGDSTGVISASNSVRGQVTPAEFGVGARYTTAGAIVVGRPAENIVTLMTPPDVAPPVFPTKPANISAVAAPGAGATNVSFSTPSATDNRGVPSVACNPVSGSSFVVGVTSVTCTATDAAGLTATTSFTVTVTTSNDYVPLGPARVADTRPGFATVDGLEAGSGLRAGGSTLELALAGRGGVATDAVAATLNVTVVEPAADGFVTVYPCGESQPTASNVNFTTGATVPNAVLAKIGTAGRVCVFTSQPAHLIVDVNGFFPSTSSYRSVNPSRVLETRAGHTTVDGLQQATGAANADSVTALQIIGRAGMPVGATSVALNVTVTDPAAAGYLTVYPCGTTRPTASNLNYLAGATVANLVVSRIGTGGNVCIYTQSSTHLIADINGYFPSVTSYVAVDPGRLLDTRIGSTTIDGQSVGAGVQPTSTVNAVTVIGRGGVPAGASTVVVNVTVTEPEAPGFVTAYPCGIDPPLASNLNFAAGQTVANAAIVKVGAGGSICLFNSQPTHLVVDVAGYFPT